MVMEFSIVGGYIKVHKKVFIQDMLGKDSRIRRILNWKSTSDFAKGHPWVSEADSDGIITITFSSDTSVNVGESPKELLSALKSDYRDKIKGKVAFRAVYSMYGGVFTFDIDLNSDDGEIQYEMQ